MSVVIALAAVYLGLPIVVAIPLSRWIERHEERERLNAAFKRAGAILD